MKRILLVILLACVPALASAQAPYYQPPTQALAPPMVVFPGSANAVLAVDGAVGTPSMSFASHPTTGWYWNASDNIVGTQAGIAAILINNNLVRLNAGTTLGWSSGNVTAAVEDTTLTRTAAGKVSLTGTTPMLQFGGTTSSFPALKQSSTQLQVRLADDSNYGPLVVSTLQATSFWLLGNNISASITAPTISSGFGTSPSVLSNEGTLTFRVNVGTGGVATSGVLTMPAAANGWNCSVQDMTTNVATRQSASTTTTVTVTAASAWAASDTLSFICFGY